VTGRATVLICDGPIEAALASLEAPWNSRTLAPPVTGGSCGAWIEFQGAVRDLEGDPPVPIAALEYEAHREMAIHQMQRIVRGLLEAYPIVAMLVIHRVGRVEVGEASILVRILSPHRREALAACAEFIDELKKWVPIWKHPVTPSLPSPASARAGSTRPQNPRA